VNSRAIRLLELDAVRARLEEIAATMPGRALVRALQPSRDIEEVRARLRQTSEARRLEDEFGTPPFGGISDVSPELQRARTGAQLDAGSLLAIANGAAGARRLKEFLSRANREVFPILSGDAAWIAPRTDIERAVADAIDDNGEIKDDASLELLRARRAARQMQGQIQARLRQMLADPNVQPHLQDAFVTVRDGRYCLPVRADSRARVPGIVHDRSTKGAFFVEPQAVVEHNNRLRELAEEEKEAIRVILSELSARVAGAADDLKASLDASVRLDFAFAKARLSSLMDAREIPVHAAEKTPSYALIQACHPLVHNCVPNDIFLGDSTVNNPKTDNEDTEPKPGFDVMLITGPNTGGKTVVMKTLGLLTLMTACGLHIPVAHNSYIALPGDIFADIGDEQSIEQSLSTFSAHIKNIVAILKQARAGDLVLLDEAGAGTDPDEGAALAKAILRTLQRRGCLVVATTHYGELKQFALSARRFRNASVEFDIATLRPTYRLRIGVPGASNALDIAARLGMPPDLIARGRKYLGRERAAADEATKNLEETQRELTQRAEAAAREQSESENLRRQYEARIQKLQDEMQREIARARRDATTLVAQTQREADEILRSLRRAAREGGKGESRETEAARQRLRALGDKTGANRSATRAVEEVEAEVEAKESARRMPEIERTSPLPKVGGAVRVKNLDKEGILLSEPDARGRCEVRIGAMKLRVPTSNLEAAKSQGGPGGIAAIKVRKSVTIPEEINLIGQSIGDALPTLEKYLDDAILADVKSVRVVHGKGTGALRGAIHRALKGHRGVESFAIASPNEGGEGATIIELG
jgi:DNA mismatch repair protein MutS2